jgi:hypothetical protein
MIRKKLEIVEGAGRVRFSGHEGLVQYAIEGNPVRLKLGQGRLHGSFSIDAENAKAAFRAGVGVLTLEGGAEYRVTMVGHTAGDSEVFVELRV